MLQEVILRILRESCLVRYSGLISHPAYSDPTRKAEASLFLTRPDLRGGERRPQLHNSIIPRGMRE